MTKFEDWPLWLQLPLGVANAVGLVWAVVWTPKTQKGLNWVYAFLAYVFLFQLIFVWRSAIAYLVAAVVGLAIGIGVFRRASSTEYWPTNQNR